MSALVSRRSRQATCTRAREVWLRETRAREACCLFAFEKGNREEALRLLPLVKDPVKLRTGSVWISTDRCRKESTGANLLHLSARNGWLEITRDLITNYGFDARSCDRWGYTCLHYALSGDSCTIDIVKYLIECAKCDPHLASADYDRVIPLHCATRNKSTDIFKYLISESNCDPMSVDGHGQTPLHYAVLNKSTDILKYLITECNCRVDWHGQTPLTFAIHHKSTDIVKYLITECNCDPMSVDGWGQTPLHHAVNLGYMHLIEYLLSTGKCDPLARDKDGRTPISMAGKRWNSEDLLQIFSKFGQVKTSHPVDSYVNVLLLGNPGAGKSTLAQVIIDTATTGFAVLGQFRTVRRVELCTAGIIPTKIQHSRLGNIILYDLAGHSEYYTSHTAVIENLLQGSGAVFVLVVNIFEAKVLKHLQQWLTVVRNEAHKALDQCHVVVVASHVDEMSDPVTRKRRMEELKQIITQRWGKDVSFTCLDCRKLGGGSINSFFSELSSACQSIRSTSGRNLTLYCHMMYGLLEERKQNVLTLCDIRAAAKDNNRYILPEGEEELLETLSLLHSTGLICLLKSQDEVWVIVNKQILLAEVDGILFAPKTFKQHRAGIVSNTGIMSVSALGELFPNYDPNMLICFLMNMALCQEINPHFLSTVTNLQSVGDSNDRGRMLFFPTLLDIPRPREMTSQVYQFGWCLQCTQEHDFFPSRYFHVLLLHLAFKYTLPQQTDELSRHCTFWRNGLHWFNGCGIRTLVETVDESQCVLVLMSSEEGYRENMASLRRKVIGEVLSTYKESCPSLKVEEFLIGPTEELVYPMNKPTERTLYSVQNMISCVLERRPFIVTATGTRQIELKKILTDESLEPSDCSTLSLLGGRDLKELTDITPCTATAADHLHVLVLRNNPEIAQEVVQSNITLIMDSHIDCLRLADKLREKKIISDSQRRKAKDEMSGQTADRRIGDLLDAVQKTAKVDGTVFDIFINILREEDTVLCDKLAETLEKQYDDLVIS